MFKKLSVIIYLVIMAMILSAATSVAAEEEKVLNVYFWFEYLPDEVVKAFEKESGIKVVLDTFESLDTMETKLLAGKSGYDIVIPDYVMADRLIKLDIFQKLDKSKLSNWGNLDPVVLAKLAQFDDGNAYGVPYLWGTIGIAFNDAMVKERLPKADLRSGDLFFKPENISKLSECGVAILDSWSEAIPIALNYLGLDPHSVEKSDLQKAEKLLMSIRPHVRHFNSGAIIEELATGELCAALTYSGDGGLASLRADELKNGVFVDYSILKEGTIAYFDFMAIPAEAKHPDNAHKFFDFLMRPDQIAKVTNEIWFANANAASLAHVAEEVKTDPDIYPPSEVMKKLFPMASPSPKDKRNYTRMWTKVKAAK